MPSGVPRFQKPIPARRARSGLDPHPLRAGSGVRGHTARPRFSAVAWSRPRSILARIQRRPQARWECRQWCLGASERARREGIAVTVHVGSCSGVDAFIRPPEVAALSVRYSPTGGRSGRTTASPASASRIVVGQHPSVRGRLRLAVSPASRRRVRRRGRGLQGRWPAFVEQPQRPCAGSRRRTRPSTGTGRKRATDMEDGLWRRPVFGSCLVSGVAGRCRGGTGGRSSLVDRWVRLIFEGWLPQDPVRRGSPPRIGRGPPVAGLPIAAVREPADGAWAFLVLVRAPAARRARWWISWSVRLAASQQNAASSRAQATATVPAGLPRSWRRCPQRSCRRRWARQAISTTRGSWPAWRRASVVADARRVAVVVGGLDQQPAGVRRAGLGDRALAALAVGGVLAWARSRGSPPAGWAGESARSRRPRRHSPAAESVSMPRKQRSLAIISAWPPPGPPLEHARSASRGAPTSSPTAAR